MSPGLPAPISYTAKRASSGAANTASGNPISLLKLPGLAYAPPICAKIDSSKVLTEVLPLLPVTANTLVLRSRCTAAARSASARSVLGTMICAIATSTGWATNAATQPPLVAACRCAWPSKFSPFSATKSAPSSVLRAPSPACGGRVAGRGSARVSVATASTQPSAPCKLPPVTAAIHASERGFMRASAAACARSAHHQTDVSYPPHLDRARGLCRRSTPHRQRQHVQALG